LENIEQRVAHRKSDDLTFYHIRIKLEQHAMSSLYPDI